MVSLPVLYLLSSAPSAPYTAATTTTTSRLYTPTALLAKMPRPPDIMLPYTLYTPSHFTYRLFTFSNITPHHSTRLGHLLRPLYTFSYHMQPLHIHQYNSTSLHATRTLITFSMHFLIAHAALSHSSVQLHITSHYRTMIYSFHLTPTKQTHSIKTCIEKKKERRQEEDEEEEE